MKETGMLYAILMPYMVADFLTRENLQLACRM
ncbi:hypothetical protein CGRA01v4_14091 [Colletotrichum graminicola]|nr:hypothetical protein CGRA01v4_14091 [Colletotrichum graminicola]